VEQNKPPTILSSYVQSIAPHGRDGLAVLDDEKIKWLLNTCPEI